MLRSDRLTHAGGVMALYQSNISIKLIRSISINNLSEVLSFDIFPSNQLRIDRPIRFIACYRTPGSTPEIKRTGFQLISELDSLVDSENRSHVVLGDFNAPSIDWKCNRAFDSFDKSLLDFACLHSMIQTVNKPTMVKRTGIKSNTLDIILVDNSSLVTSTRVCDRFSTCDHLPVEFILRIENTPEHQKPQLMRNFKQANWDVINSAIDSVRWTQVFIGKTVEQAASKFYEIINDIIDSNIPLVAPAIKRPRLLPRYLHKLKRQAFKLSKTRPHSIESDRSQRRLRKAIISWNCKRESKLILNGNKSAFFRDVRNKMHPDGGIGAVCQDGEFIHNTLEKCEIFADYFDSVYHNTTAPPGTDLPKLSHSLDMIDITFLGVHKIISKLDSKYNTSPDGINNVFLKRTVNSISVPLTILFAMSMSVREIPSIWKEAWVKPLFKKGSRESVSNYRPISLTCSISKVMERICVQQITYYLEKHGLLSKKQFGFRKNRSTNAQLIECHMNWCKHASSDFVIDCIYFDFKKAFDTINHDLLFKKLDAIGIRGNALGWIIEFLKNRKQSIMIGSKRSSPRVVNCGVPQGSCLGPLLFNIFIDNIPDNLPEDVYYALYADDLKISYHFNYASTTAATIFQKAIDTVTAWSASWGLQISTEKTQILHIGKRNPRHTYTAHGCVLKPTDSAKDLGILMSNNLLFRDHLKQIVQQTLYSINDFFRTYKTRNPTLLITAYTTYFRCKLEYCTELWNPTDVASVNLIESIQRYYTRRVCQRIGRNFSYPERLLFFNLQSLENRRFLNDVTYIHKVIHSKTTLDYHGLFAIIPTRTRSSHEFRIVPSFDHTGRTSTFLSRTFVIWNSLPHDLVSINDPSVFKSQLSTLDLMPPSKLRNL